MFWITFLFDTPNGYFLFRYISETGAVLIFGVTLILATIGLRWFLKRYEGTKTEGETKEIVKR